MGVAEPVSTYIKTKFVNNFQRQVSKGFDMLYFKTSPFEKTFTFYHFTEILLNIGAQFLQVLLHTIKNSHCMKTVGICSFSVLYFPTFGLSLRTYTDD